MIVLFEIQPSKTYATRENAVKAVERKFGPRMKLDGKEEYVRYFIAQHTDGRFFPVFIGQPALQAGMHFHFNVIA